MQGGARREEEPHHGDRPGGVVRPLEGDRDKEQVEQVDAPPGGPQRKGHGGEDDGRLVVEVVVPHAHQKANKDREEDLLFRGNFRKIP